MTALFDQGVPHPAGHREVTAEQVAAHRRGARVIDVRETQEFSGELGHIPGAELVPLGAVANTAAGWAKDADYVLVCRSGRRSEQAAAWLIAMGFGRVMNMVGGMLAWNEAGLGVER